MLKEMWAVRALCVSTEESGPAPLPTGTHRTSSVPEVASSGCALVYHLYPRLVRQILNLVHKPQVCLSKLLAHISHVQNQAVRWHMAG